MTNDRKSTRGTGCQFRSQREPDGLAMSSRNARLTADDRKKAVAISAALQGATERIIEGAAPADVVAEVCGERLGSFVSHAPTGIDSMLARRAGRVPWRPSLYAGGGCHIGVWGGRGLCRRGGRRRAGRDTGNEARTARACGGSCKVRGGAPD